MRISKATFGRLGMLVDFRGAAGALIIFAATCGAASAHVVLEAKQAKVGAGYKAVLGVPHGCAGSPTTEVIVDIPEGVIGVKPMPKPGWTLTLSKGPYARSYAFYHGEAKSEGIKQVTWSGGSLSDDYFDQFVLSTFIAGELEPGAKLYFPVTQKCANGEQRWSEVPVAGQDAHSLEHPAPQLMLVAGEEKHDHGVKAATPAGTIEIAAPWTRPAASVGGTGAGYMKITNNGTEADMLLGGSSEAAERVEVHETAVDDKGVASMRKLDAVELKPGQSIELKPAGMHLMLIGLKEPLKVGGTLKAQLNFKKAGKVDVELVVKTAGGDAGGHEHMHHDH
jgi:periplasmic copper chaperone A